MPGECVRSGESSGIGGVAATTTAMTLGSSGWRQPGACPGQWPVQSMRHPSPVWLVLGSRAPEVDVLSCFGDTGDRGQVTRIPSE